MNFGKLTIFSMLALVIAIPSRLRGAQAAQHNETKGVCSPIASNNQGSITISCSGFSDKQYHVLRDFLDQLSSDQAKQQDLLLSKLNEVLETLRKQESESKPRIIPDSDLQQIARASWGTIPVSNILVIAPTGDVEAENFAKQIVGVFDRGGMNVRMAYKDIKRGPDDPDLLVIHNAMNYVCVNYLLLGSPFGHQLSVKYERIKPPPNLTDRAAAEKFQFDTGVLLSIVVYPKKS